MIRCAKVEDLPQIAKLHFECFPDSFSTILGKGKKGHLLEKYYYEYLLSFPELFLVSENEDQEITGICMGYYCEKNNQAKMYLKHNLFFIAFRMLRLLLVGNKAAWGKVFAKRKQKINLLDGIVGNYADSQKGDILSICVHPEYRGKNMAGALVDEFIATLKRNDREMCVLSVKNENMRAINFYKKMGFCGYMQTETGLHMYKVIE